jgi:O-antigen ligase
MIAPFRSVSPVSTAPAASAIAVCVVTLPFLLAPSITPTSTFLNQWLAVIGVAWALVGIALAGWTSTGIGPGRVAGWLMATVGLLAASQLVTHAPLGQRWVPFGCLVLSMAVIWSMAVVMRGSQGATPPGHEAAWNVSTALMSALLLAGLLSVVVGVIQVFAPSLADGALVAYPTTPGRAIGNMRQPNQLSTVLLWSCGAAVWLAVLRRWSTTWLAVVLVALVLGVVLTASRTGTVGVLLLALWGLADRRLPGRVRLLMVGCLLVYLLGWYGMEQWSLRTGDVFYGDDQVRKTLHGDASSSRGKIWRNTLALMAQYPWTGVGPGAYNFVWSLSVFPDRPVAFFDHSHNLPMQLAVESGLPFAALVLGLLGWVGWSAIRAWRVADDAAARSARALSFMLALVGVHSLLEYPLWYTYFLLPTAALAGWLTALIPARQRDAGQPGRGGWAPTLAGAVGAVMVVASLWAAVQYYWVATIFDPELTLVGEPDPLPVRIARGQRSVLFGHHADYAQVTMSPHPGQVARDFDRALYHLVDTRLMMTYAKALDNAGDRARADHVAARLREFRNPAADEFLAPCRAKPASTSFPCAADPALPAAALRPEQAFPRQGSASAPR